MGQEVSFVQWQSDWNWSIIRALLPCKIKDKDINIKPRFPSNPYGVLDTAHLKLDAALYPWYFRLFCNAALKELSWWRRKWIKDLYIKRSDKPKSCTTMPPELDLHGGVVDLRLDSRLSDEELDLLPFKQCVGTQPHQCRLIPIYLLHAMHKESPTRTLDVFIMLVRSPCVKNGSSCYRRIGLVWLTNEGGTVRTWDKVIDGRIKSVKEEFWLL